MTVEEVVRLPLGRPEVLEESASVLLGQAGRVDAVAAGLGQDIATLASGWRGSAETLAVARVDEVRVGATRLAEQLREVGRATQVRAGALADARARLLRLQEDETAAVVAADPAALHRVSTAAETLRAEDDESARRLAQALAEATSAVAAAELLESIERPVGAVSSVKDGGAALVGLGHAGVYWADRVRTRVTPTAPTAPTAPTVRDGALDHATQAERMTAERHAARQARMSSTVERARLGDKRLTDPLVVRALEAVQRRVPERFSRWGAGAGAWASSPVGVVLRRGSAAVTLHDAGLDVVRGDAEHPGWRDVATRGMGVVGVGGSAALLIGVANPLGAGLAVTAVAGYAAWKAGVAIYDNWPTIKGGALTAGRWIGQQARTTAAAVRSRAAATLQRGRAVGQQGRAWAQETMRNTVDHARSAAVEQAEQASGRGKQAWGEFTGRLASAAGPTPLSGVPGAR